MAQSVDGRGVDPVDACIQRGVNRRDGFIVPLLAPGEGPVAATHRPCANTDGSDRQVRVAQTSSLHKLFGDDSKPTKLPSVVVSALLPKSKSMSFSQLAGV